MLCPPFSPPHERPARSLRRIASCALALMACSDSSAKHDVHSEAGVRRDELDAATKEARTDAAQGAASAALHAKAKAMLTQIRPRPLVDLATADTTSLDAVTSEWPIEGTATFNTTRDGIDLVLLVQYCRGGYAYPTRIYEGSDCGAITKDTPPWDAKRGTIPPPAPCLGAPGGSLYYSRSREDAAAWTLGGPAQTNVIGRAIAVLDPDTLEPLVCGTIEAAEESKVHDASLPSLPSASTLAQLTGVCLFRQVQKIFPAVDAGPCPDDGELADCSVTHCGLSDCLARCTDQVACLEAADEPCSIDCQPSDDCALCLRTVMPCALGFCEEELDCAPPATPGGPCTELKACCERQGPLVDACKKQVQQLERLGGDPTCLGTQFDWDFNSNFAYRSPCYPDAGTEP